MSQKKFEILISWLADKADHYQRMGFKNLPELYRQQIKRLQNATQEKHTASKKDQATTNN